MKTWLCIGDKKHPKCLFGHCKIVDDVGAWGHTVHRMQVTCDLQFKPITVMITHCEKYQNRRLTEFEKPTENDIGKN